MRSLVGFLCLLLVACEPNPYVDGGCAPSDEPSLKIGTGELDYEPLASGDPLRPEFGPQGGQHVVLAFEATGLNVRDNPVEIEATVRVDGKDVASMYSFLEFRCNAQVEALFSRGVFAPFFDYSFSYNNTPALVMADVTDVDGRAVSASQLVTLADQ